MATFVSQQSSWLLDGRWTEHQAGIWWPVGTGAIETPPRWVEEGTGGERGGVTWRTIMEASGYCDGGGAFTPQVPHANLGPWGGLSLPPPQHCAVMRGHRQLKPTS